MDNHNSPPERNVLPRLVIFIYNSVNMGRGTEIVYMK